MEDLLCKQVKIDGQSCILEVFELAGQEVYTALRDRWIKYRDGFILVYSAKSRSLFAHIPKPHWHIRWLRETALSGSPDYQESSPSTISNGLESFGPSPVTLVANICDRVTERMVFSQEGFALTNELGCGFVEASTKNPVNVEGVFYDVVRQLRRQRHIVEQPAKAKRREGPQYPSPGYYQSDDYVLSLKNGMASSCRFDYREY